MAKFDVGKFYMTDCVSQKAANNWEFLKFISDCLERHMNGDWGDMDAEDKTANDRTLIRGNDQLFSVYKPANHPNWRIWIVTEADRSSTTILFPGEY